MAYQSLEALLADHDEDVVFRAAMKYLLIIEQAQWRRDNRKLHVVSQQENDKQLRESKYYVPPIPKYRPIPDDLAIAQLTQCADSNECASCAAAYREYLQTNKPVVPCHDCAHPCSMDKHGNVVCTNASCFLFNQ